MTNENENLTVPEVSEEEALQELKRGYRKAEELLQNTDKTEKFLQKLEKKIKTIPGAGGALSYIPIMASLVNSYIKKEYTEIPIGIIVAVLSALIYFLSPIDLIIDAIPGLGSLDDIAVVLACLKLVESDLKDYEKWREENGKLLEI